MLNLRVVSASGMRNSDGLWNDGLDTDTCKNNGQVRRCSQPIGHLN
jgi:hypothetical protein